ncbi:hypothetical protein VPH35_079636 [Triticum aestivum]
MATMHMMKKFAALGAGSREVRSSAAGGVPSGFAAVLVGVPVLRRLGAGGACMVTGLGWARLDLAPAGTSRATLLVGSAWCCCDGGRRWSGASGSGVKEGCGQGVGRCGGGLAWMRNGLVLDGSAARGGDAPELGGRRWRCCHRAPLHDSPGEIPSFGWSRRAMMAATSFPSLRHRLGESAFAVCMDLFIVGDSGCRGGGFEWFLIVRRDGDLGNNVSDNSMRGVGSVDAPQRGRSNFTSGRRPRMWCDVRGLRAVALSSVGCRQLGCAALLLEGSGGRPGRWCRLIALGARERWMSGRRPRENHCGDQTTEATMMVGAMSATRQWLR